MPVLRIYSGGNTDVHTLDDQTVTIGRDASNTIPLEDRAASSRHAEIVKRGRAWWIRDCKSTNGTLLNDDPIESAELNQDDRILIGTTEIVFDGRAASPLSESSDTSRSASVLHSFLGESSIRPNSGAVSLPSLLIDDDTSDRAAADSVYAFVNLDIRDASHQTLIVDSESIHSSTNSVTAHAGESLAETKLRLIQRVSEKLVRIFDPQRLLDEIMSIVVAQTGADRGVLCLLDEQRQPIPIAARGLQEDEQVRVSRTVLKRILDGRTGVVINQTASSDDVLHSLQEMQIQSTICAPLWTGDDIIGIVSLDSTTMGKCFTQTDLELLLVVAHQAAIGIERGRLSNQVESERQVRNYLSKYLDNQIVEQISAGTGGEDPLAPAERELTILFSDIVSFTKLAESLQPAQLADFMRQYLTVMTEVIFSHGGTIDKYIGDAVMALFGAPVPSDNAAASAIRAALAMRARIRECTLPGFQKSDLRMRVGINTGRAVVGNLGSERRMEYTALGDAVNVASRLEMFARPNEICIDEITYQLAGTSFIVEEIGDIDVKNRSDPVIVYKVLHETH